MKKRSVSPASAAVAARRKGGVEKIEANVCQVYIYLMYLQSNLQLTITMYLEGMHTVVFSCTCIVLYTTCTYHLPVEKCIHIYAYVIFCYFLS